MAIDGQTAEKLRGFLRELTPRARALLLAELERSEQRGQPLPGGDLIMRELREADKAAVRSAEKAVAKSVEATPAKPAVVADAPSAPIVVPAEAPLTDREGQAVRLFFNCI